MMRVGAVRWTTLLCSSFLFFSVGCPTEEPGPKEICDNFEDDDGDDLIDCLDDDCDSECVDEICDNQLDDDDDGDIDCLDTDCDGQCLEVCTDARDNDGDGAIDCLDADCIGSCSEMCGDLVDNDGNGLTDCDDPVCEASCDADGDGYDSVELGGDDCDDDDIDTHPGALEVCDFRDNDCDSAVDDFDDDTVGLLPWYPDSDRDGAGLRDAEPSHMLCEGFPGIAGTNDDCDDTDDTIHPGAPEVCGDGVDQDCNGSDVPC